MKYNNNDHVNFLTNMAKCERYILYIVSVITVIMLVIFIIYCVLNPPPITTDAIMSIKTYENNNTLINEGLMHPIANSFIDNKINPCVNFCSFTCGNCKKNSYYMFNEVNLKMNHFVKKVNEEIKLHHTFGIKRKIDSEMNLNKFYNSCANSNLNNVVGERMKEMIKIIESNNEVNKIMAEFYNYGFQPLLYFSYIEHEKYTSRNTNKVRLTIEVTTPTTFKVSDHVNSIIFKNINIQYTNQLEVIATYDEILKSYKHIQNIAPAEYIELSLEEINDLFFSSMIDIQKYLKFIDTEILYNANLKIIITHQTLSMLVYIDNMLLNMSTSKLIDFMKYYAAIGITQRFQHILHGSNTDQGDVCIRYTKLFFPISYCEAVKEFIGEDLSKSINSLYQNVGAMVTHFKSEMINRYNKSDARGGRKIKNILNAFSTLKVNIAECYSLIWENNLNNLTNAQPLSLFEKKIKLEYYADSPPNQPEGSYVNSSFITNVRQMIRSKTFKLHRKNFIRNMHTPSDQLVLIGEKRLYNIINEISPRYNIVSHELIFPIPSVLSPLVSTRYTFNIQYSYFTHFVMHELTHVMQYLNYDSTVTPKSLEDDADIKGMEMALGFISKFNMISRETFLNILHVWCTKKSMKLYDIIDDVHSVGCDRINNIVSGINLKAKKKFNDLFKC